MQCVNTLEISICENYFVTKKIIAICLLTRLFLSEQACVICGTKGQEGQIINAGNIDRQQGNIHNRTSIIILNSKHSAEKKIYRYPDGSWILMLPQDAILQSKDIHTAVLEIFLLSLAV